MMANKVAGVVMGGIMMVAAVVLLALFNTMVFPCAVLGFIGFLALRDGLTDDEVEKKENQDQIGRGR